MKKAQAAMEFLTTYGWSLVILLTVIGGFSYYIGFDQTAKVPNRCDFGFDFSCGEYTADENGTLIFEMTNMLGRTINVSFITIKSIDQGWTQYLDYREHDAQINPGEKVVIRTYPLVCAGQLDLFNFTNKKEKFEVNIMYNFNEEEALTKIANGEIIVTILNDEINTTNINIFEPADLIFIKNDNETMSDAKGYNVTATCPTGGGGDGNTDIVAQTWSVN